MRCSEVLAHRHWHFATVAIGAPRGRVCPRGRLGRRRANKSCRHHDLRSLCVSKRESVILIDITWHLCYKPKQILGSRSLPAACGSKERLQEKRVAYKELRENTSA